jgi:hypothetical protein
MLERIRNTYRLREVKSDGVHERSWRIISMPISLLARVDGLYYPGNGYACGKLRLGYSPVNALRNPSCMVNH